jgi:hypothetical protein
MDIAVNLLSTFGKNFGGSNHETLRERKYWPGASASEIQKDIPYP